MTKEQFVQLIRDIAEQMPDKGIRLKFLFNEFNKYGLSVFDGTTITNYFYNELKKLVNGEKSVFNYDKVIRQNGTIGFLDKFTCYLKVTDQFFADLEDLLTVNRYENVINNLNKMYDFAKLFSGKYSGQLWTVGTIPETALEITEIELLFKYWKQIIQETINAAPDKQKEINNFLSLCDIGISTILPKCKDPYENKEINEYWLSQYEALKIFVAAFGRHIPETSTAEPPKEDNDKDETKEEKVRRLLAPLKEIGSAGIPILDNGSFEKLVTTYINWIVNKKEPHCKDLISIHGLNEEFFTPLNELHIEFDIPYSGVGIGAILNKIIPLRGQRGDHGEPMAPSTIEKYIKTKGKYY
jgi:hypothetical protein